MLHRKFVAICDHDWQEKLKIMIRLLISSDLMALHVKDMTKITYVK